MIKLKQEIITDLTCSFKLLSQTCLSVEPQQFNVSKENKWSIAENIKHLINATRMTILAFNLPKFVPYVLYGKPNRTSHAYTKIIENYHKKLSAGATATGLYVPTKSFYDKQKLATSISQQGDKLIIALDKKWSDEELDNYQIEHPILGLLTHRELAYFTIYHNGHHLETITDLYQTAKAK